MFCVTLALYVKKKKNRKENTVLINYVNPPVVLRDGVI